MFRFFFVLSEKTRSTQKFTPKTTTATTITTTTTITHDKI